LHIFAEAVAEKAASANAAKANEIDFILNPLKWFDYRE
jgi:hypothetical protein